MQSDYTALRAKAEAAFNAASLTSKEGERSSPKQEMGAVRVTLSNHPDLLRNFELSQQRIIDAALLDASFSGAKEALGKAYDDWALLFETHAGVLRNNHHSFPDKETFQDSKDQMLNQLSIAVLGVAVSDSSHLYPKVGSLKERLGEIELPLTRQTQAEVKAAHAATVISDVVADAYQHKPQSITLKTLFTEIEKTDAAGLNQKLTEYAMLSMTEPKVIKAEKTAQDALQDLVGFLAKKSTELGGDFAAVAQHAALEGETSLANQIQNVTNGVMGTKSHADRVSKVVTGLERV